MSDKNARPPKPDLRGSKHKFQSVTTSAFKSKQSLDQPGKGSVPFSKPGLASLGKVTGRRLPKPHIESRRTENYGEDPDVQLVPKDGSGWAKSAEVGAADGETSGSRKKDTGLAANSNAYIGNNTVSNSKLWSDPNPGGVSSQRPIRTANSNDFPTLSGGKPEREPSENSSFSLKPNRPSWKQGASGKFDDRDDSGPKNSGELVEQDSEYSHYPDMKPAFMKPKDQNTQKNMNPVSPAQTAVFRTKREEWKGSSINKESKELDKIVELDKDAEGWAGATGEVDYSKKIVFSDDEGDDSGGSSDSRDRSKKRHGYNTAFNSGENTSRTRNSSNKENNLDSKYGGGRDDFFRGGSLRSSDGNRYASSGASSNNLRKSDNSSFFQTDRENANQRRPNSFYDSRSSEQKPQRSSNPRSEFQESNRRLNSSQSQDFHNRGAPGSNYSANPPFPPSYKSSNYPSNSSQAPPHPSSERQRPFSCSQDAHEYKKPQGTRPGEDDRQFFRGSEMSQQQQQQQQRGGRRMDEGGRFLGDKMPPSQHHQQSSLPSGRYDSNSGVGNYGNSSSRQQNSTRNRYDSEGSNSGGKVSMGSSNNNDPMRNMQMQFKGSSAMDSNGLGKGGAQTSNAATTTMPFMFAPPPPPPPQLMGQITQQQMWHSFMLAASRFPFPMQMVPPPPVPPTSGAPVQPPNLMASVEVPPNAVTSENIPRPPPEGAASVAESPLLNSGSNRYSQQNKMITSPSQRMKGFPEDEDIDRYSSPPPQKEVRPKRVQRTMKVQLTDSSQPDPNDKPSDEPVKILERPKDRGGKDQRMVSAASLFHAPKTSASTEEENESSNNEGAMAKESSQQGGYRKRMERDASYVEENEDFKYGSQQQSNKPRSGYGSSYGSLSKVGERDQPQSRGKDPREVRGLDGFGGSQDRHQRSGGPPLALTTANNNSSSYEEFEDDNIGYRGSRAPVQRGNQSKTSPIAAHGQDYPRQSQSTQQSRSWEVRRGGRGMSYSGPSSAARGRPVAMSGPQSYRDREPGSGSTSFRSNERQVDYGDNDYPGYDHRPRSRDDRSAGNASFYNKRDVPDTTEVKDLMAQEIRFDDLSENNRQKLQQDFLGSGTRRSDSNAGSAPAASTASSASERYGKRFATSSSSSAAFASRGSTRSSAGRHPMSSNQGGAAPEVIALESNENFASPFPKNDSHHRPGAFIDSGKEDKDFSTSDPVSTISTATTESTTENSSVSNHSGSKVANSTVVEWNSDSPAASTLFSAGNNEPEKEPLTLKTSSATNSSSLKSEDHNDQPLALRTESEPSAEEVAAFSDAQDREGKENEDSSPKNRAGKSYESGKQLPIGSSKARGASAGTTWEIKASSSRAVAPQRGVSTGSRRGVSVGKQARSAYYDRNMYYYGDMYYYGGGGNYGDYDYAYSHQAGYLSYHRSEYSQRSAMAQPVSYYTSQSMASRKQASGVTRASARRGAGFKDKKRLVTSSRGARETSSSSKTFNEAILDPQRYPNAAPPSIDAQNQEEWETASESSDFERRDSKNDKVPVAANGGVDNYQMTTQMTPSGRYSEQRSGKNVAPKKSFSSQRPVASADRGRNNNTSVNGHLGSSASAANQPSESKRGKSDTSTGENTTQRRRGPDISQYDVNRRSGVVVLEDHQNMRPNIASDDDLADETFQEVVSKRSKSLKAAANKKSLSPTGGSATAGQKEKVSPKVKGGITKRASKPPREGQKTKNSGGVNASQERSQSGRRGLAEGKDERAMNSMQNIQNFESIQRQISKSNNRAGMPVEQHEQLQSDPASSGKNSMPTTPPPARTSNAWDKPLQTLILQDNQLVPSLPMASTTTGDPSKEPSTRNHHPTGVVDPSQSDRTEVSSWISQGQFMNPKKEVVVSQTAASAAPTRQFTSRLYKSQQLLTSAVTEHSDPVVSAGRSAEGVSTHHERMHTDGGSRPRLENSSDAAIDFYAENSELNTYLKNFESKSELMGPNPAAESATLSVHTADSLRLAESADDSSMKQQIEDNLRHVWADNKDDDFIVGQSTATSLSHGVVEDQQHLPLSAAGQSAAVKSQSVPSSLEQTKVCTVKPQKQSSSFRSNQMPSSGQLGAMNINAATSSSMPGIGMHDYHAHQLSSSMEMQNTMGTAAMLAHGHGANAVLNQPAYFEDTLNYSMYGGASNGGHGGFFDSPSAGNMGSFQDMTAAVVQQQLQQQQQAQPVGASHQQQYMGAQKSSVPHHQQQNIGAVPPNNSAATWNNAGHNIFYGEQSQPSQNAPLGNQQPGNSPYQQTIFNNMSNTPFNSFGFGVFNTLGGAPRGQQSSGQAPPHPYMTQSAQHHSYGHLMNSGSLQPAALTNATFPSPQHPVQPSFDLNMTPYATNQTGHPGGKAMSPQSHHAASNGASEFKHEFQMTNPYGFNDASVFNQAASNSFKPQDQQQQQQPHHFMTNYGAPKNTSQFMQASSAFNAIGSQQSNQPQNHNSPFATGGAFIGSKMFAAPNIAASKTDALIQAQKQFGNLGALSSFHGFGTGHNPAQFSHKPASHNQTTMHMGSNVGGQAPNGAPQSLMQSQNAATPSAGGFTGHGFHSSATSAPVSRMPAPIQRPNTMFRPRVANPMGGTGMSANMNNIFSSNTMNAAFSSPMNQAVGQQSMKRNNALNERNSPGMSSRPWSSDLGAASSANATGLPNSSIAAKFPPNTFNFNSSSGYGGSNSIQRSAANNYQQQQTFGPRSMNYPMTSNNSMVEPSSRFGSANFKPELDVEVATNASQTPKTNVEGKSTGVQSKAASTAEVGVNSMFDHELMGSTGSGGTNADASDQMTSDHHLEKNNSASNMSIAVD